MKIPTILPSAAAAAVLALAGVASAHSVGVADAFDSVTTAESGAPQDYSRRDRNRERRDRNQNPAASQASTYGAGSVQTNRNSSRAVVVSGGRASGEGRAATSTTVDAYGETTRDGSSADIFGSSTARVAPLPQPPLSPDPHAAALRGPSEGGPRYRQSGARP